MACTRAPAPAARWWRRPTGTRAYATAGASSGKRTASRSARRSTARGRSSTRCTRTARAGQAEARTRQGKAHRAGLSDYTGRVLALLAVAVMIALALGYRLYSRVVAAN